MVQAGGTQCDKCKANMELINIFDDYTALLGCGRCKIKKTKDLDERVLKKNFNHTSRSLENENVCLMIRKGVNPYEYMDGWKKFEETSLLPKDSFYSRFSMKDFSDQDYEHAKQVWNGEKDDGLLS